MSRKLLVVDDNEQVLHLVQRLLSHLDFDVVTALGPEEAIAWCARFGKPDLLISDVRMPVMSGPRLYDTLVQMLGDFPVLFISGDTGGYWDVERRILEKPFSRTDLVNAVNSYFSTEG